jgi:hypothetical protein
MDSSTTGSFVAAGRKLLVAAAALAAGCVVALLPQGATVEQLANECSLQHSALDASRAG